MLTKEAIIEILKDGSLYEEQQIIGWGDEGPIEYVLKEEAFADRLLEAAKGETARSGVPVVDTAWISVKDEMPKEIESFLVINAAGVTHLATYMPHRKGWVHKDTGRPLVHITHYYRVPQPPQ